MTSSLLRGNIILQMDVSEKLSEDRHCLPIINGSVNYCWKLFLGYICFQHLLSNLITAHYLECAVPGNIRILPLTPQKGLEYPGGWGLL